MKHHYQHFKRLIIILIVVGLTACGGSTGTGNSETDNQQPLANTQSLNVDEDTSLGITLDGQDSDDDELSYRIVSQPTQGSLSGLAPNLNYTPNDNYHGDDNFSFVVNDGEQDSEPAVINISITAINDTPTAQAFDLVVTQDTAEQTTLLGQDTETSDLNFRVVSSPDHGVLSGAAPNLTYTPDSSYTGEDSFAYVSNDGELDSLPATVSISIVAIEVTNNTATLNWTAPTARTDNSSLSLSELGGYKIYSGSSENNLTLLATISDNSITEYTVTNLENGVHYFAVSAFDVDEMESDLSDVGNKTIAM